MNFTYIESSPELKRQIRFRAFLGCFELDEAAPKKARILDVGGGDGLHARFFRNRGYMVDVLDLREGMEPLIHEGEYEKFEPTNPYDVIWCSHVYEHIMNPGFFLEKIFGDLKPGGWVAVTVPPMKSDMLFEHVTLWNAGLLLIHLIKSGFDARNAHVGSYHYNITVFAQKPVEPLKQKHMDLLPAVEKRGGYFEGNIKFINWKHQALEMSKGYDLRNQPVEELVRKASSDPSPPLFSISLMRSTGRPAYMYLDHVEEIIIPVA